MKTALNGFALLALCLGSVHADTVFTVDARSNCGLGGNVSGPTFHLEAGTRTVEFLSGSWSPWSSNGQHGGLTWGAQVIAYVHATSDVHGMFHTAYYSTPAAAEAASQGLTYDIELLIDSDVTFSVSDTPCSDNRGSVTLSIQEDQLVSAAEQPAHFTLAPNVPNPFNPSTELRFQLEQTAEVELAVFNLAGERVALLAQGLHERGEHSVTFQAETLASGAYIARLSSEGRQQSRKLLLLK